MNTIAMQLQVPSKTKDVFQKRLLFKMNLIFCVIKKSQVRLLTQVQLLTQSYSKVRGYGNS
jgi:hypothetical protein